MFVAGLVLVGRSVRRMFGPIGEVMEAADRVAGGDYSTRVSARGPGEVRRLGHAFNEMTTRLQASDDQRRRLLADVTHELRTPLAVVQGNLEAMVDGVHALDEEHLLTVLEETRVMARLLDDLQTLSTADAGALRLDLEPTDLAAVADEVVSAFAPTAALAGVSAHQRRRRAARGRRRSFPHPPGARQPRRKRSPAHTGGRRGDHSAHA